MSAAQASPDLQASGSVADVSPLARLLQDQTAVVAHSGLLTTIAKTSMSSFLMLRSTNRQLRALCTDWMLGQIKNVRPAKKQPPRGGILADSPPLLTGGHYLIVSRAIGTR